MTTGNFSKVRVTTGTCGYRHPTFLISTSYWYIVRAAACSSHSQLYSSDLFSAASNSVRILLPVHLKDFPRVDGIMIFCKKINFRNNVCIYIFCFNIYITQGSHYIHIFLPAEGCSAVSDVLFYHSSLWFLWLISAEIYPRWEFVLGMRNILMMLRSIIHSSTQYPL